MKRLMTLLLAAALSLTAFAQQKDTLRILAVGNSFSQDAVEQYLWELFDAAGIPVIIGNLYIGGCTLERHFQNSVTDKSIYSYRKVKNGVKTTREPVTLAAGLADEPWDYVSFQQASGFSGEYETFEPYLLALRAYVRRRVPADARFMWHQTWAYSADADHHDFPRYGRDQQRMYEAIVAASRAVMKNHKFPVLIPAGTAIQNGRTSRLGDTFNADGYHLERTYGRYTAACTWFEAISGLDVTANPYHPSSISPETALICRKAAHAAVRKPWRQTKLSK